MIPQEAAYHETVSCEVGKVVKMRVEMRGEMYAVKLPAAKNARFFNNVSLVDTPRGRIL